MDEISIYGAREHNLKNIDLTIPRNKLVVFTGLSGSGKSSLAFNTIYAEGQRRYLETFSSYARQFLGGLERPDVDKIEGLSPVIAIEQKTVGQNPRSTVGTITELYDFLRLLFARTATAYSYKTGEKMIKYSDEQIVDLIIEEYTGKKIALLAPLVKARKGHYRELFEQLLKMGFTKARIDGQVQDIQSGMKLDRYKTHDIDLLIDRIQVDRKDKDRIHQSVILALKHGNKEMMVMDIHSLQIRHFSRLLMCPSSGISYPEPEPNLFSFNTPYGACPECNGLGFILQASMDKIIPDPNKTIYQGGIIPLGEYKQNWIFDRLQNYLSSLGYTLKTPIAKMPQEVIKAILYGNFEESSPEKIERKFDGIIDLINRHAQESSTSIQRWATSFMHQSGCPTCQGTRLKQEALYFRIADKNIGELAAMDLTELDNYFKTIEHSFTEDQARIAQEILKEIRSRLTFILGVGLEYLSLNRPSQTLSGGEAQRIRLATQIGSELINVLYILDEPSIGLHQRDNTRLIQSLKKLRDSGNSVIVVEHDKEMIEEADFIVDIGPGAGQHGGEIINATTLKNLLDQNSLTAQYIKGIKKIAIPAVRRKGNGNFIELIGASGHNLKNVRLKIPLETFTCVTGVSGSGKSSLINQTLYPILLAEIYNGVRIPLPYKSINGLQHIDKVIEIDQKPIGRTPRSNPATYSKVFDEIRLLFSALPEAQIRGYKPGRFSFNVIGGRCETCKGGGMKLIEMNFLPNVYVPCETCNGKRYNKETLQVKYKGLSIGDVLDMTIEKAEKFFEPLPKIHRILHTLQSVGLGYVKIGQASTTLSGGEAQRIKLATELAKKGTGKTLYILDEPSTGLHFDDIKHLLNVLQKLVDEKNTVLVIEHNLDIIKVADHIIDVGPEGGQKGGQIIAEGTPEKIIKKYDATSYTAHYLSKELS